MEPLLQLEGITKVYPGVVANRNVSFDLRTGEIHAVCGENGAGKSTLMKIIFGMERPSEGRMLLDGAPVQIGSPRVAIQLGIGMVHQHFMLVPSFTVAENVVLGIEPTRFGKIDRRKVLRETRAIAERYHLKLLPEAKVEAITVGMMQKLEILKALYRGARILILDEPTAVLTPQESEELFEELLQLKDAGHTIVFISHKLKEVKRISDRVTIMRRGEVTGSFATCNVSEAQISERMIGKVVATQSAAVDLSPGDPVVVVRDLTLRTTSGKHTLDRVGFEVRSGEILGVAGVEGNGQAELVAILTGRLPFDAGVVTYHGHEVRAQGLRYVRSLGVAYIPEDRIKVGCAVGGTVWENLITNRIEHPQFSRRSIMKRGAIRAHAGALVQEFDIDCPTIDSTVSVLSGGNIQKVVVARECANDATILIADQPTRGVDVGAAARIHRKMLDLRRAGAAILLVSSDLTELLELATRLIVVFEGRISASFETIAQLDETKLGYSMLGLKERGAVR